MKQFLSFVKKEFYHIFRDRQTMLILLGMPIVQIIIFGFALTNEVKNTRIAILDHSKDAATRSITAKLDASKYFDIERSLTTQNEIAQTFQRSKVKLVVVFPQNFYDDLQHFNKAQVQLIADASDPNLANTVTNYASAILLDWLDNLKQGRKLPYTIETKTRMLYNPQLKGAYSMVPGVMAMVLMMVCTMMTAITVVKEKELGTMEVLLASPIRPIKIIMAKAVPNLALSIVNISTILLLSVYVLNVPINGSLLLLVFESILFTLCCLALGLLISTATDSQQTAMFVSLTGMFLPTVMLSGFMFPVENMPVVLRTISNIVPAKWYYLIVKAVMIKGVGFTAVWKETMVLTMMTVLLLFLSIKKFRIRLA